MKDILKHGIILFVIVFVCSFALIGVNSQTAEIIARNKEKQETEARMVVLPQADSFLEVEEGIFKGEKDGKTVGYTVNASANGFGGEIRILVGINPDGTISGVSILEMSETAGLGTKANNPGFLGQYLGKSGELKIVKGSAKNESEISAISGATITSNGVTSAVNSAIKTLADKGYINK